MNSRTTWILIFLAIGLGAYIYFIDRHLQPGGEFPLSSLVLPDLNPASVESISVRPAQHLEICANRTNKTWQLTKPISYPAANLSVEALLKIFEQLMWRSRITAGELKNRTQYSKEFGFDDAPFSLVIHQGDQQWQIVLGSQTPFGDEIYLQVIGRNEIYVVSGELLRAIPRTPDDWRNPAIVDLKNIAFDRLVVTNGIKAFELQRNVTNGVWRLARPLAARADSPRVDQLLEKLQTLYFTEFVDQDPKTDQESLGLLSPDLSLSFFNADEPVVELYFGKCPTNQPAQVYARRSDTEGIGRVSKEPLAPWSGGFDDFRDRHLLSLAGRQVARLEIHGAEDFTLKRYTNDTWSVEASPEALIDSRLVRELIGTIVGMQIAQFVKSVVTEPDLVNYGLDAPVRRIAVCFQGEGSATNQSAVQLDFGATTNGNIYVRRGDETAVYAVSLADFRSLPGESWQLRDRRLWNFSENEVRKLTVHNGIAKRELLHQGSNQWAFAAGSQGVINNFAVEEAAGTLGELSAAAWTARGAAAFAQYGFTDTTNRVSAEVRQNDKTETFTLELGGTAPSGLQYGAVVLDGEPWVFELPARISEVIASYLGYSTSLR